MAAWDGDARTTRICRDAQLCVCVKVCVSLCAPHMEKPVWGGASGLLLKASVEDRTVQWILCSPDAHAWDRWGGHEVLCPWCPPQSTAQAAACCL
jgi:hypothetical protein